MRALFSFRGELPRGQWLRQFLGAMVAGMVLQVAIEVLPTDDAFIDRLSGAALAAYSALLLLIIIACIAPGWIMVASTAKRARYFGRSPWGCLMVFLPFFGWMLALIYYGQADETALRARI